MGAVYYPQASVILRVRWEDYGDKTKDYLEKVYDLPILARRVTVNINDYTQADTFDCEIDYKSFPFDPRAIRACGITIYMQNMGKIFNSDNSLHQIAPGEENAVFVGFADEESISFDDSKRTVKLEGRDYTGLFVDRKYPHGTVNLEQSVDVVIQKIIDDLDNTKKIKLDNRIPDKLPVLSSFWGNQGQMAGHKNVDENHTYWDVIQDVVNRAGLIAYIELDKLVLTKPRVLYNSSNSKIFVYGRNLSNLEFKRKIGRMKGFNVAVRSLKLSTKEILLAKIPAEATDDWSKATGIANKENIVQALKPDGTPDVTKQGQPPQPAPYLSFRVPDVSDKKHLIEIGQKIYEEVGRQQLEGSFETKDMETAEGIKKNEETGAITLTGDKCFNILKLRVGTPIVVQIDQGDLKGLSKYTSVSQRQAFLQARCFKPEVARALAETIGKYDSVFYTKAVTFTMDAEQGFSAKVEFINFIQLPQSLGGSNA